MVDCELYLLYIVDFRLWIPLSIGTRSVSQQPWTTDGRCLPVRSVARTSPLTRISTDTWISMKVWRGRRTDRYIVNRSLTSFLLGLSLLVVIYHKIKINLDSSLKYHWHASVYHFQIFVLTNVNTVNTTPGLTVSSKFTWWGIKVWTIYLLVFFVYL